jgi:hypothetical protein
LHANGKKPWILSKLSPLKKNGLLKDGRPTGSNPVISGLPVIRPQSTANFPEMGLLARVQWVLDYAGPATCMI